MIATMRWASALSQAGEVDAAVRECSLALRSTLGEAQPDVLFAFVTPRLAAEGARLPDRLRHEIPHRHFLGCTAGGVAGAGNEVEEGPALAVLAAMLPGVSVQPFHLTQDELPDLDGGPRPWEAAVGVKAAEAPHFVVLADPYSIRADDALAGLDFAFPRSQKVGGLASGRGEGGRPNALYLDGRNLDAGFIGLALTGNIRLDCLVAQGCRPIGQPLTITQCRKNLLVTLNGRKPMEILAELFQKSSDADRELIRRALFLGLLMDPLRLEAPKAGDFLIRNLIGQNAEAGALAIGALLREGQTVQFHVRDAQAARHDLQAVLRRYTADALQEGKGEALPPPAAGALLFTCMGRGQHMYGEAGHDSRIFREQLGDVPLGGFFCNGEAGPVGGTTYLHGFTSCFGIFRPKE